MCTKSELSCRLYRFDLNFKTPAVTSRGTYRTHTVWYPALYIKDRLVAIGEIAPLPDLSSDFLRCGNNIQERTANFERKVTEKTQKVFAALKSGIMPDAEELRDESAVLTGIETMLAGYLRFSETGSASSVLWSSDFTESKRSITINGLIWMASFEEMASSIRKKTEQGFRCIKLKIGAIDFDKECALLEGLRKNFDRKTLELRVDANGAFSPEDALSKLKILSKFDLHSIEQPIKQGQFDLMAELCANSPVSIALDEELIGVNRKEDRKKLLDVIKPAYIILKPSLHGGFYGCREWISLAGERNIGFWMTSALESNIGLNAIAQWYAALPEDASAMPQGLGTGLLYTNNIDGLLFTEGEKLHFNLDAALSAAEKTDAFLRTNAVCIYQSSRKRVMS